MCLLKAKKAKGAQKRKVKTAPPVHWDLPGCHVANHAGTADGQQEDEEVGRATWEQCRTSLFWTAWMKLGKPDLSWI